MDKTFVTAYVSTLFIPLVGYLVCRLWDLLVCWCKYRHEHQYLLKWHEQYHLLDDHTDANKDGASSAEVIDKAVPVAGDRLSALREHPSAQ